MSTNVGFGMLKIVKTRTKANDSAFIRNNLCWKQFESITQDLCKKLCFHAASRKRYFIIQHYWNKLTGLMLFLGELINL